MSDKRLYHVHGRYLALYDTNRESGEISLNTELRASDAGQAIQQVAKQETRRYGYAAFIWLRVAAEPVETGAA